MSGISSSGAKLLASVWSCTNCRRRKVRCNRTNPCIHCARTGTPCVFPQSGRLPRRPPAITGGEPAEGKSRQLLDRIKRLEAIVNAFDAEPGPRREPTPTELPGRTPRNSGRPQNAQTDISQNGSSSGGDSMEDHRDAGVLVTGEDGTLYVGGDFWSILRREVSHIREAFEATEEENQQRSVSGSISRSLASSWKQSASGHSTWIFKSPSTVPSTSIDELLPMPSQMFFTWQTYVENIDPFLKVVHVPTITETLKASKCRLTIMDPAMCALISCISFASIASLTEEEVYLNYATDKTTLSLRFRAGAEAALARADFLNTASLTTVQAFTIFLSVLQREESTRFVWSLTGVLIRLAVSIGLHKDGSRLKGMKPFEIEMRRRTWWHICFLDSRSGDNQVYEARIAEALFDTQCPSNIDDTDIDPQATGPVTPRDTSTDMSICLIRCRVWRMVRAMRTPEKHVEADNAADNRRKLARSLDTIRDFRQSLGSPPPPVWAGGLERDAYVHMIADMVASRLELMARYQDLLSRNADSASQHDLFGLAMKVVDLAYELGQATSMSRWAWLSQGFLQWQPFVIILSHISAVPWGPVSEEAWTSVTRYIETMPEAIKNEPLWQPMQRMLSKAERNRSLQGTYLASASLEVASRLEMSTSHNEQPLPFSSTPPARGAKAGQWDFGAVDSSSVAGYNSLALNWMADLEGADPAQWLIW